MELRQIRYAAQVAADKSFSRAAEKLHIAQPSLSQQIARLESELGVLLFKRTTGFVELTYAGERFMEKAQKILDLAEQLKQEMEDISELKRGRLVVGSLPITGSHIMPLVLPVYKSRYPQVEIVLTEDTTANLEALTTQGKTDFSLLTLPLLEQSLEYEKLIEEEVCLALPHGHRLAAAPPGSGGGTVGGSSGSGSAGAAEEIDLSELRDEPFVLLKQGQGFRQIVMDLCEAAGFQPRVVFESANIETVQSLVAAGMGIAFVPEMVTRSPRSRFVPVYRHLAGRPTRTLVIAYKHGRYLSNAAKAFISTMTEVVRSAQEQGEL
mgnify:CR=1 FL=1|jgi:DNA-binding transcriptional LysR family regulator